MIILIKKKVYDVNHKSVLESTDLFIKLIPMCNLIFYFKLNDTCAHISHMLWHHGINQEKLTNLTLKFGVYCNFNYDISILPKLTLKYLYLCNVNPSSTSV